MTLQVVINDLNAELKTKFDNGKHVGEHEAMNMIMGKFGDLADYTRSYFIRGVSLLFLNSPIVITAKRKKIKVGMYATVIGRYSPTLYTYYSFSVSEDEDSLLNMELGDIVAFLKKRKTERYQAVKEMDTIAVEDFLADLKKHGISLGAFDELHKKYSLLSHASLKILIGD